MEYYLSKKKISRARLYYHRKLLNLIVIITESFECFYIVRPKNIHIFRYDRATCFDFILFKDNICKMRVCVGSKLVFGSPIHWNSKQQFISLKRKIKSFKNIKFPIESVEAI